MLEYIVFALFITTMFVSVLTNVKLKIENINLTNKNLQLIIDSVEMTKILEKNLANKEEEPIEKSEGFLTFISQSREWAFAYIENVQGIVNKFVKDIEPEIAYFDEFGEVGSAYPHYHSMKKISAAYKELKEILPDNMIK